MNQQLRRFFRLFFPQRKLAASAVLAALALVAMPVSAQIVVDDFEDGEFAPDAFTFSGGEEGTLSITPETPDGSSFAAQFDVDADEIGGFAGFGQPIDGGALDISSVENGVLVFDAAATGTFTLEINFQNTGGGGEGEIRNALRFVDADGSYQRYRLSLASFFPTNAATFDLDDVFQYVWTILDATGDGNGGTMETRLRLDNVQIVEGLGFDTAVVAEDFDDGDFSEGNGFFYFAGGEFITASPTTDTPDGSANAFSGLIDGDEYGGYAGFGATLASAPIDVTSQESFNFFLRANGDALLEVNLQTDAAAGGSEGRERIRVSDTGGEYVRYSIPLEAFFQTGANPPNFANLYNFVFTFVELAGDGNTGTTEFEFAIDALGFGTQAGAVAGEATPEALTAAPSVYPNPASGAATVAFDLAAPSEVTVDVVDLLGRRVVTLARGPQAAGAVRIDVPSGALAPGVYLVRVQTETGLASSRLTIVR